MSDMINGCEVIAHQRTPAAPMTRAGRFILAKVKKENCFVGDDGKTQDEWVTAWHGDGDDSWIEGHYFKDRTAAEHDFVMRAYPDLRLSISRFGDGMESVGREGGSLAGHFDRFLSDVKTAIFNAVTAKGNEAIVCPVCFDTLPNGDPMHAEVTECDGPGDTSTHEFTEMVSIEKAAAKAAAFRSSLNRVTDACNDTIRGAVASMITVHVGDAQSSIDSNDIETATLHLAKSNKVASSLIELQSAVAEAKEVLK